MKTSFVLSALLLAAACGDNLEPEQTDDQTSSGTQDGSGDPTARPIYASMTVYMPSCDAPVAQYEVDARYSDVSEIELVPNFSCAVRFDDGTTSTSCAGDHELAEAGFHEIAAEVTDLDTGVTARSVQNRYVYPPIEANLDVSTDDLSITWNATTNVGTEVHVFVEPADKIITDDPAYHQNRSYTLQVREAGTYTVIMTVEDERQNGPICEERIEKHVTVSCTGGDNTHTH